MILKGLLALLTQRPEFRRLVQQIQKAEGLPALTGITETARPFVASALSAALKEPLLLVVADEAQALQVVDTLKAMAQSARRYPLYAGPRCPALRALDKRCMRQRSSA